MKFGVFMPPHHHAVGENPTLALGEDLELIEELEHLGYDEIWIGEHHSGATEIYGSPELMIAAAAQRTKHVKLGTGVIDLPFHHPFNVADRMVQLDHMTRGRAMLGVGSGARNADFWMLGHDPANKARMSGEAIEAIIRLLRDPEPVTMKTDWFELKEARLQLASYTYPHLPVAVAGTASPDGQPASGRYGLWQLSGGSPEGLAKTWGRVEAAAEQYGQTVTRENFRAMKFVHIAETREQALEECRIGMANHPAPQLVGLTPESDRMTRPEAALAGGGAIIGSVDDVKAAMENLLEGSGGFGGFLFAILGYANPKDTMKSFDLFSRWIAPHFTGQYQTMKDNWDWVIATKGGPNGQAR